MANPISKLNLVINGVTTQLDVHDANALTAEIDSMGEGWVRFKCGLQICYGRVRNNNNIETGRSRFSFPMAFSVSPTVVATPALNSLYSVTADVESGSTWVLGVMTFYFSPVVFTPDGVLADYVAIGKWK